MCSESKTINEKRNEHQVVPEVSCEDEPKKVPVLKILYVDVDCVVVQVGDEICLNELNIDLILTTPSIFLFECPAKSGVVARNVLKFRKALPLIAALFIISDISLIFTFLL